MLGPLHPSGGPLIRAIIISSGTKSNYIIVTRGSAADRGRDRGATESRDGPPPETFVSNVRSGTPPAVLFVDKVRVSS